LLDGERGDGFDDGGEHLSNRSQGVQKIHILDKLYSQFNISNNFSENSIITLRVAI